MLTSQEMREMSIGTGATITPIPSVINPLPCPFCGHSANVTWSSVGNKCHVFCSNCDDCPALQPSTGWLDSRDEAVRVWNMRANIKNL